MEVHRQSKYFKDNTVFISNLYQGGFNPNNFIYKKNLQNDTQKCHSRLCFNVPAVQLK